MIYRGYIYEFRNVLTNEYYVGQTVRLKDRYNEHIKGNSNTRFGKAMLEYGSENFEFNVVFKLTASTKGDLKVLMNKHEKEQIIKRDSLEHGYNMTTGGEGGNSECCAWNKGLTKETDERVAKNAKAVSKAMIGNKNSVRNTTKGKIQINNGKRYKFVSEEKCQKLLATGKWVRGKMKSRLKKQKYFVLTDKIPKKYNAVSGQKFNTMNEIAQYFNLNNNTISNWVRKRWVMKFIIITNI